MKHPCRLGEAVSEGVAGIPARALRASVESRRAAKLANRRQQPPCAVGG